MGSYQDYWWPKLRDGRVEPSLWTCRSIGENRQGNLEEASCLLTRRYNNLSTTWRSRMMECDHLCELVILLKWIDKGIWKRRVVHWPESITTYLPTWQSRMMGRDHLYGLPFYWGESVSWFWKEQVVHWLEGITTCRLTVDRLVQWPEGMTTLDRWSKVEWYSCKQV